MTVKNKAKRLTGINPLAYMGVEPTTPSQFVTDNRAPTARDIDGFNLGTIWLNTVTEEPYMLTNMDAGVATWTLLAPGGTGANTFNTNTFGPVHDIGGILNLVGDATTITTDGSIANTVVISLAANPVIPGVITTWTRELNAAVPMAINHGYVNTNAGLTTFTMPAVAAVGDAVELIGESAAGWSIILNAGQSIQVANVATTVTTGSISSHNRWDTIKITCRVANTTWSAVRWTGTPNII